MGYCVDMSINVTIPKEKIEGCLQAINAIHVPIIVGEYGNGGCNHPGGKKESYYSWVNNPGKKGFSSLELALEEWRYEIILNEDGGLTVEYFSGEKWGDDEQLYYAIAPFVTQWDTIECRGGDGHIWGYLFKDEVAWQSDGEIIFPDWPKVGRDQ